jgi:CubicO group peptidase (beta-lactamase class C family)
MTETGSAPDAREPQRWLTCTTTVAAPRPQPWARPATEPAPLDLEFAGAGTTVRLDAYLELSHTTAFLVVVDGVLVEERYPGGTRPTDRLLGYSATKSVLTQLVGLAVDAGALPDLDAPARQWVPDLAGGGYAQVSVRDLLTMTSGVDWVEDHRDPDGPATQLVRRWREGRGGMRELCRRIPPGVTPGSRFAYCTADSLVLDWVRERATGRDFAGALADLWATIGAEHPAVVGLDGPAETGVAMAGGGLAATARDWARLGVLQIDGRWQGRRVLSRSWVDASSRPATAYLAPGRLPSTITTHAGFGRAWWPLDAAGRRVMADGMAGQFVYVDRRRRVVVVKTSAWPFADAWLDRQLRDLSYLALPAVAEAAAAAALTRARPGG